MREGASGRKLVHLFELPSRPLAWGMTGDTLFLAIDPRVDSIVCERSFGTPV